MDRFQQLLWRPLWLVIYQTRTPHAHLSSDFLAFQSHFHNSKLKLHVTQVSFDKKMTRKLIKLPPSSSQRDRRANYVAEQKFSKKAAKLMMYMDRNQTGFRICIPNLTWARVALKGCNSFGRIDPVTWPDLRVPPSGKGGRAAAEALPGTTTAADTGVRIYFRQSGEQCGERLWFCNG